MKKLIKFTVDYPITILMIVLAVVLLGFISFKKLGMDLFPDLNNPRIFIELKAGERPPEEIEKQFVKNIESQAIRQKNAIQVSSVSRVGSAQVTVEYSWNTNMDEAFLDLQKSLNDFSGMSEIDEMTITQHDPNASPVILLALSHPQIDDMDELRKVAESYIRNELIRLEGIADVRLLGQEEKEVVVETNNYLLDAYGITPSIIASRIQEYNRNISGGSITEMGTKYVIKGVGEFGSIEDISQVIISYVDPGILEGQAATTAQSPRNDEQVPVYLKDIATVRMLNKKPDNIVRLDGRRCMGLAIYKETKYNTVTAVNEFMKTIESLRKTLPDFELTIIQNQGEFIATAIDEVKQTAIYGVLFAVMVLFVFLRRVGTTAIISIAIPISIIATFNLMYFNDLTLNIMTLGGLALGAGMLVDNAIVVMENIFRKLESGSSLRDAAIDGTSQVSGAITASTLTTIVVFLPIVYLHGSSGELFREQAWTVAFSLLSSLFVALFVIPMISTRLLKSSKNTSRIAGSIRFPGYSGFLRRILKIRWIIILGAIGIVFAAVRLLPVVGSEFIPKTDLNEFSLEFKLPEGTDLYRTDSTVMGIESNIQDILGAEIKTIFSIAGPSKEIIGDNSTLFQDENTATIKIILNKDRLISSDNVFAQLGEIAGNVPDLEAQFIQEQTAMQFSVGTESAPIALEIQGEDLDILQELTDRAKEQLLGIDALFNIETTFDEGRPEINIVFDRIRAGFYNVGINDATSQIQAQLMGTESGQWDTGGELKDITIKLPKFSINQLEGLIIKSSTRDIRLDEIADFEITQSPNEINRKNQVRIGKVTAHIADDTPLNHVVSQIRDAMNDVSFPPGYRYNITGEEQQRNDAFQNLKFALILSLALVYMVLASQFESLMHPFTIILSIPLAIAGAVFLFFILGKSLSIMAFIGIIMLVGIAVNDSIILVDAINQLKLEGIARNEAIILAGQQRIRPIIMTSLTTILALIPLTVGFGEGAALRSPMALAVIGGLTTSTILTLIVIPCVYSVIDRGTEFFTR